MKISVPLLNEYSIVIIYNTKITSNRTRYTLVDLAVPEKKEHYSNNPQTHTVSKLGRKNRFVVPA